MELKGSKTEKNLLSAFAGKLKQELNTLTMLLKQEKKVIIK